MGTPVPVERATLTLAVLGDSVAAGIGDPRGAGFGPLLAGALGERVRLVNTGCSGARVACVLRDQVPVVVAARPDVAVVLVGINDTLRADFDPAALHDLLAATVTALAGAGATVVAVRYHHHGRVFPLPRPLARALDHRIDQLNAAIDRVVRAHGVHCLDLAALPASYRTATWSVDRLHPSAGGHRTLARGFAELLGAAGLSVAVDRLDDGDDPVPSRAAQVHWLVTQGVPWVLRRSRDLLPLVVTAAVRRTGQRAVGEERV